MDTTKIKEEVEVSYNKLLQLRDEVRLRLHLASLEAKTEWDEKLEPRVFEAEQAAKNIAESRRGPLAELVQRLEDFLARLEPGKRSDRDPHSVH